MYTVSLMGLNRKNEDCWTRKLIFLLLILLMFPAASDASTQKFNFTVQKDTALNFENGSYIIDVIEISKPVYVKVNLTYNGEPKGIKTLYDSEPIIFYEITLSSSSITNTNAMIFIEFPIGWSAPKKYTVVRPVLVPNIVLTKSVDKTNIQIGDVVEIKIKIENTGNATAHNLTLSEIPSKGFTIATTFPSIKNVELAAGASQELYYSLKAVESGTLKIEPATVDYDSKTSKSNSLTITVSEAALEKSNLSTTISVDKNNVYTNDLITATVKITNTGNAATKFVDIDFTPQEGMAVIENNLDKVLDSIAPGESLNYRLTLKANEAGNYTIHLRTVYNDATAGIPSDSEPIIVTQKEQNYLYFLVPIAIIIVGILLFTIKRHREYSY